jgi:hypothetical protein
MPRGAPGYVTQAQPHRLDELTGSPGSVASQAVVTDVSGVAAYRLGYCFRVIRLAIASVYASRPAKRKVISEQRFRPGRRLVLAG